MYKLLICGIKKIRLNHLIITLAFVLALIQFAYNKSLWVDDARVALNLMEMTHSELTGELRYNQSAPVGFLQIEKLLLRVVPDSEYGMKFFPLVSFLVSILLFGKIAGRLLKNEHAVNAALAVFAFNSGMLFYSSEIKQYSSDAAIALLLFWLSSREWTDERVRLRVLALVGAVSVFVSNIAPLALAVAGVWTTVEYLKTGIEKQKLINLTALAAVWLLAFGLYWDLFVPPPESWTRRYMDWYWNTQNPAFVFEHGFGNSAVLLMRQTGAFLAFYFGTPLAAGVALSLAIAGTVVCAVKKNWRVLSFAVLPFAIHFIVSAMRMFPFAPRFLIWCFPGFVILAAAVLDELLSRMKKRGETPHRVFAFVCAGVIPLVSLASAMTDFPIASRQDFKQTIRFIADNADLENESLMVIASAGYMFEYYARIGVVSDAMLAKATGLGWKTDVDKGVNMLLRGSRTRFEDTRGKCWILNISGSDESRRFNPQNSRFKKPDSFARLEKSLISKDMSKIRETDEFYESEGATWKYMKTGFVGMKRTPGAVQNKSDLPFALPSDANLLMRFEAPGAGAYLVDFGGNNEHAN